MQNMKRSLAALVGAKPLPLFCIQKYAKHNHQMTATNAKIWVRVQKGPLH